MIKLLKFCMKHDIDIEICNAACSVIVKFRDNKTSTKCAFNIDESDIMTLIDLEICEKNILRKVAWYFGLEEDEYGNADDLKEMTCDFCNDFKSKPEGNHLYKHPNGEFIIMADTGDCFQWGAIEDVKYCPYCGRRLEDD